MGFGEVFKLDEWWKIMLFGGISLIAIGLLFQIDIVNRKHLLGVGIGMFVVGMSNVAALKTTIIPYGAGVFQGRSPIHNTFTRIMQYIGFAILVFFAILLLWGLI